MRLLSGVDVWVAPAEKSLLSKVTEGNIMSEAKSKSGSGDTKL